MTPPARGSRFNPPRVARAVVERVLPAEVRESIAGDLNEFFQRDCRTHGLWRARRTPEIGLRSALGASAGRLLVGIFSRAVLLVVGGIVAGNLFILFVVAMGGGEAGMSFVLNALRRTSAVMLVVGLLACIEPARRALTIDPTTALRDV